jgi:SulP family sulfate permease
MIGAVVLFWLVAWIADLSAADLRQAGYLLPRLDHQGEAMWSPPFLQGALAGADWQAAMLEAPKLVVLWLVTLITFLLSASTIEIATQSDVDLNRELKVAGAANLLCGLGGGLPGYQSASSTTMAYLVGGRGRTVGLVAALLCGLALAFAAPLISYLPKLLLGLMLLYAAIELATVLIRDQWARMPAADRVVLVVVLVSFLALGFLEGLVIGIVAGLAVFAFSYARVDLVREGGNAARYRSTVFRPAAQLQALDQDPDAIQVIALQGYLFFGSVHNLLQRVGVLLGAAAGGGRGAGCLILDFARVDGADASALFAFTRLLQRARKQGRPVLFAAVPPGLARALPAAAPSSTPTRCSRLWTEPKNR